MSNDQISKAAASILKMLDEDAEMTKLREKGLLRRRNGEKQRKVIRRRCGLQILEGRDK